MNRNQIISWLTENNPERLAELWAMADAVRKKAAGDVVHLRGLVEFSNICGRKCLYCGISAHNNLIKRYCMSKSEILDCVDKTSKLGYGTVVLQAGEVRNMHTDFIVDIISQIKAAAALAVTLSLGEQPEEVYRAWKQAGADRYLLRFETSDDRLYRKLHPDSKNGVAERFESLELLTKLDYEVGSGFMIGIDGQSYETLADDILTLKKLNLDMIGVGPYLKHENSAISAYAENLRLNDKEQTPATELMTYKVYALARILCPQANIPATTALATLNFNSGYETALQRGCNVVMPNVTPMKYRELYSLYQNKSCQEHLEFDMKIKQRIERISRKAGSGRGDSPKFILKHESKVSI